MIRTLSTFGVLLLALVCFALYTGVYRVKAQEHQLEEMKATLAQEAEAIRVLKAEWTNLNQPDRLQALARRHLALAPTGASQITILASLPLKAPAANAPSPVVEATDLPEAPVVINSPLPRPKPDQKAGER
jgi:hypothetical protein